MTGGGPSSHEVRIGPVWWRRLNVAALTLLLIRLAAVMHIVPPWQHPDEPQHVLAVMLLLPPIASQPGGPGRAEADIVASMVEHGWWRHLGHPDPVPAPTTFDDGPARVAGVYGPAGGSQLYYRWVALVGALLGLERAEDVLTLMRSLSLCFGILAWWPAVEGARLLAGRRVAGWAGAALALHPQFALVSTTASPDALVNVCGSLLFLCVARLATGRTDVMTLVTATAAGTAASLVRRLGLPLLGVAVLVALVGAVHRARSRSSPAGRDSRWGLAALAVVGGLALTVWARLDLVVMWEYAQRLLRENTVTIADPLGYATSLFDSAWLNAGWLTYPAPAVWRYGLRAMVSLCVLGLPLALFDDRRTRVSLAVCALLIAVQMAAVYYSYFRVGLGAQGRYMLPVIAPFLLAIGIGAEQWRRVARVSVLLLMGVMVVGLDVVFFADVLLPAYGR